MVVTPDLRLLEGRYLSPGEGVIEIESTRNHKAVVSVRERDIASLEIGQSVRMKVYGYPKKEFVGTIEKIAPAVGANEIDGLLASAIRVDVGVEDPEGILRSGMTGDARVATDEETYFDMLSRQIVHWFRIQFWW